ncbi:MAG: polysaccharide biosynthesis protein [Chitinophagaceae bacterium]|nr:polysaccharide biosynthesis protein [Chitinophagaceae bacterium]MCW5905422.1 polysaccharide biosynthesis protein [Chitinophagaceae bacterium]
MWYGLSSIAARFINYLLTPYLTYKFTEAAYGEMSIIYAFIPFMNIIFTYGMETAYFRFVNKHDAKQVFSSISISILISTFTFSILLILFHKPLATLLTIQEHTDYLYCALIIIVLDALTTIPFAKLRQDGRPIKFAVIRVVGILINIASIYFFLSICPAWLKENPNHWCNKFYHQDWAVGYVLVANIIQSAFTLLLLSKEFFAFEWKFNATLWKEMILYSMPLIIAGFAGMINETFDRIMLGWWAPVNSLEAAKAEVGIYAACYKLSILITLSVQAFRMGAEPFFFKQAKEKNAPETYARVMKFFVITLCFMFLAVVLYLDIWKHFIQNQSMWVGLKVVPVLLLANMFLGIYYNLSIWYKLGNKTIAGAYITVIGAAITLAINYFFIPYYSYMACAFATFACYGSMMLVSYVWGQKEYPIPYAWKKLSAYIIISVLLYFAHNAIIQFYSIYWFNFLAATLLIGCFAILVFVLEKKEINKLPFIGKRMD